MTYHYIKGTHEDDDREPVSAECDMCDQPIDMDVAQTYEEGVTRHAGKVYMEHVCSECRCVGNRERYDHERAHERERLG